MNSISMRAVMAATVAALAVPAVAAERPFDGAYVGAQLGWLQNRLDATATVGSTVYNGRVSHDGFAYGVYGGYDFNINGNGVLGLEVGVGGNSGDYSLDGSEDTLSTGRTFDVTARAGALISPQTLVYARGGWTNARFTADVDGERDSANKDGFLVGAGLEQALGTNASARLEYNYSKFGRFSGEDELTGISGSVRPDRHAVKAGVSFRF